MRSATPTRSRRLFGRSRPQAPSRCPRARASVCGHFCSFHYLRTCAEYILTSVSTARLVLLAWGQGVARPALQEDVMTWLLMQWFGGIVFSETEGPAEWGPMPVPNGFGPMHVPNG